MFCSHSHLFSKKNVCSIAQVAQREARRLLHEKICAFYCASCTLCKVPKDDSPNPSHSKISRFFAACSQSSRLWGGFQGWDFRLHNAISLHVYTKGFCGASALRAWPKMPTGTSTVRQNRFLVSTHQNAPFRWIWRFISPFFFRVVIIMEFCAKLRIVVKIPSYSLCVCVLYTLNRR